MQGAHRLLHAGGGPQLDGEGDELAVLLDQPAQLLVIGILPGIWLEVQRDARAARQLTGRLGPHLVRVRAGLRLPHKHLRGGRMGAGRGRGKGVVRAGARDGELCMSVRASIVDESPPQSALSPANTNTAYMDARTWMQGTSAEAPPLLNRSEERSGSPS